jgi:tRNA threonylcarbamoyladenosine biosynthesis protein TsaB
VLILTIRTDKPEAEIGLFSNMTKVVYEQWAADRQLSESIHKKIRALLKENAKTLKDVEGIVCFRGPGSFTGLRIGLSVGNALAYGLEIPIIASGEDDWISNGSAKLLNGENDETAMPEYGSPPHITVPKH